MSEPDEAGGRRLAKGTWVWFGDERHQVVGQGGSEVHLLSAAGEWTTIYIAALMAAPKFRLLSDATCSPTAPRPAPERARQAALRRDRSAGGPASSVPASPTCSIWPRFRSPPASSSAPGCRWCVTSRAT